MCPVLFEVFGARIPAYGTTLVAVFIAGLLILRRQTRILGVSDEHMFDIATICSGTVLLWIVFGTITAELGLSRGPALSALPVLALGAFAMLAYLRRRKLPAEEIFDILAPMASIALAIQYGIGTFLAGTVFGKPTTLPWGVSFPPGSPAHEAFGSAPLQPVQLYLAILLIVVALASWYWTGRARPGQRALVTFVAIATVYLAMSPLRGNTTSFLAGDTIRESEAVALFIIAFCAFKFERRARRT